LDDWSGAATPEMLVELERCLELRAGGYPIQYIVGGWEFYGQPVALGPGVLIPRQDTEVLVDLAVAHLKQAALPALEVVDLGSGSGCIAMAVKAECPGSRVTAVEISGEAAAFLERNIAGSGLEIATFLGDMREYTHSRPIDLLLSNPPYIPRGELAGLQVEVRHEPTLALDGGADGLDFYRAIAGRYKTQLAPSGVIMLEIGAGQREDVCGILAGCGFADIAAKNDLNGIPRVVVAKWESGIGERKTIQC